MSKCDCLTCESSCDNGVCNEDAGTCDMNCSICLMPVIDCENKPNNNYKNKQLRTMTIAVDDWEKHKKWAELGRLAMKTRGTICSMPAFIERGSKNCKNHCTNFKFCQLRKELEGAK